MWTFSNSNKGLFSVRFAAATNDLHSFEKRSAQSRHCLSPAASVRIDNHPLLKQSTTPRQWRLMSRKKTKAAQGKNCFQKGQKPYKYQKIAASKALCVSRLNSDLCQANIPANQPSPQR
jgi:hypothetical protein